MDEQNSTIDSSLLLLLNGMQYTTTLLAAKQNFGWQEQESCAYYEIMRYIELQYKYSNDSLTREIAANHLNR